MFTPCSKLTIFKLPDDESCTEPREAVMQAHMLGKYNCDVIFRCKWLFHWPWDWWSLRDPPSSVRMGLDSLAGFANCHRTEALANFQNIKTNKMKMVYSFHIFAVHSYIQQEHLPFLMPLLLGDISQCGVENWQRAVSGDQSVAPVNYIDMCSGSTYEMSSHGWRYRPCFSLFWSR